MASETTQEIGNRHQLLTTPPAEVLFPQHITTESSEKSIDAAIQIIERCTQCYLTNTDRFYQEHGSSSNSTQLRSEFQAAQQQLSALEISDFSSSQLSPEKYQRFEQLRTLLDMMSSELAVHEQAASTASPPFLQGLSQMESPSVPRKTKESSSQETRDSLYRVNVCSELKKVLGTTQARNGAVLPSVVAARVEPCVKLPATTVPMPRQPSPVSSASSCSRLRAVSDASSLGNLVSRLGSLHISKTEPTELGLTQFQKHVKAIKKIDMELIGLFAEATVNADILPALEQYCAKLQEIEVA